jgi:hypothetical protein
MAGHSSQALDPWLLRSSAASIAVVPRFAASTDQVGGLEAPGSGQGGPATLDRGIDPRGTGPFQFGFSFLHAGLLVGGKRLV